MKDTKKTQCRYKAEDEDLLSVIVPVYNTEHYIGRCIESILASTYKKLELILVDDGSSDKSLAVCQSYEKQDKRVRLFRKANGGMSSARNVGMDAMRGRYLAFVDSDDYIDEKMYEALISILHKEDVLVAECAWLEFDERGNEKRGRLERFGRMPLRKVRKGMLNDGRYTGGGISGIASSITRAFPSFRARRHGSTRSCASGRTSISSSGYMRVQKASFS